MLDVKKPAKIYQAFNNFRDVAFIPNKYSDKCKIKEGLIFRSASLSKYNPERVSSFLQEHNIVYLLDLRGLREVEKYHQYSGPYRNGLKEKFVIQIPMDPRVNIYFSDNYYQNFYYAVLRDYKNQIKSVFQEYLAYAFNKGVVIHCEWGKDRTGIISALLLDLIGINRDIIIEDYLLTGMDTKKEYMEFVLDVLDKEYGGTVNYLTTYCKIPLHSLNLIKIKLVKDI